MTVADYLGWDVSELKPVSRRGAPPQPPRFVGLFTGGAGSDPFFGSSIYRLDSARSPSRVLLSASAESAHPLSLPLSLCRIPSLLVQLCNNDSRSASPRIHRYNELDFSSCSV